MGQSRSSLSAAGPASYERMLHLWPEGWHAASAVTLGAFVYVVAHMVVRLAFSDVIAVDWVGETVYAQTIGWGQTPKYPPLPAWCLWLVHQVTGPGALSTLIVKYAALWAAAVAYFFAARRVLADDRWAVLAVLCLLLVFPVAWNAHEGVTHTIFLILAAPLSLLMLLRVSETRKAGDYALLGCVIAIGALAKQAYFAGLIPLLLAMALQPRYRAALTDWKVLIAAAVAAALAGPHYVWALTSGFDFGGAASATLARPGLDSLAEQVASGLVSSIRAPLLFLSPLLPVLLLVMPRAFAWSNIVHPGRHGATGGDPVRLVRDSLLFAIAVMVVPVLVAGVAHYGERWMHPLMLLAPIYLVAMLRAARPRAAQINILLGIIFVVSVVALGWRLAGFVYPSSLTCGKCRLEVPYGDLATGVRGLGFKEGTILAGDEHIAGNLRTHFPEARVVALNYGYYDPPPGTGAGQCLIVWRSAPRQSTTVVPATALAYAGLDGLPDAAEVQAFRLPHGDYVRGDDYAVSQFAAVLMPGAGRCR